MPLFCFNRCISFWRRSLSSLNFFFSLLWSCLASFFIFPVALLYSLKYSALYLGHLAKYLTDKKLIRRKLSYNFLNIRNIWIKMLLPFWYLQPSFFIITTQYFNISHLTRLFLIRNSNTIYPLKCTKRQKLNDFCLPVSRINKHKFCLCLSFLFLLLLKTKSK